MGINYVFCILIDVNIATYPVMVYIQSFVFLGCGVTFSKKEHLKQYYSHAF